MPPELTINDILKLFPIILVLMLINQGYWLLITALFPKIINNARTQYKSPIRITLVGLAVTVPAFLIGFQILGKSSNSILEVVGFLIGVLPLIIGAVGSAGLCQLIGHGLPSPIDQSQNWKRVWRGGWVINLCYLLPFIGWFLFLPWGIISGCGALVLSIIAKKKPAKNNSRSRNNQRQVRGPNNKSKNTEINKESPRSVRQQRTQIPNNNSDSNQKKQHIQRSPRIQKTD
ncbi:MAG: hypothetical protein VYB35_05230 [Verrucomicrobiota bacterium]|nr:hypothetical protein [Verrucomicrobiota bacterium]